MTLEEDRVYDDRTGKMDVLVACGTGVVSVAASGDRVGRFGMAHRCTARDVATADGRLAVATDEDVLRGEFEPTGFGPATAVGFDGTDLLAAGDDGRLARLPDGADDWTTLGSVEAVRAIDGSLVAAEDGIYRLGDDGIRHAGLSDVRDVSALGVPLAATGDGLYALGNGWMDELPGAFDAVSVGHDGRAIAAGEDGVFVRPADDDEWVESEIPTDECVVAVTHAPSATLAITETGTLLLDRGDGWRDRALGLPDVGGVAVR